MEYFRTKLKGERVYVSLSSKHGGGEMIYRVRDGHAMWGYTRNDIIPEKEYLSNLKNEIKKDPS